MSKKVRTLLVGIGGYGGLYPDLYRKFPEIYEDLCEFAGVVDPYAEKAGCYSFIKNMGIPVYDAMEAFFKENSAGLAVISTPIQFHKEQCITAMKNGCNVLCEKPLVPLESDAREILAAEEQYKRRVGVGFQWSFSKTMTALKSDVMSGRFGKLITAKSLVCWKRPFSYYDGSWKGNLYDHDGALILDSVVTNATAHYLHNIFFVLGGEMNTAATPAYVEAEVYRAKKIESFDTCVLRGEFPGGGRFFYGATHSGDKSDCTKFIYKFEKADIRFNIDDLNDYVTAEFTDGQVIEYGNPQAFGELNEKFLCMLKSCRENTAIPCGVKTILPHLKACNGLFDTVGISGVPEEFIHEESEPRGTYVHGLSDVLEKAFNTEKLPYELNAKWASPPVKFSIYPENK